MSRRAQDNIVAAVLLLGFLAVIVMSLDYSPRSRFVPLPVAILGAALVALQLVWQNLRSADELNVDVLELLTGQVREKAPRDGAGAPKGRSGVLKEASAYGAVILPPRLVPAARPDPVDLPLHGRLPDPDRLLPLAEKPRSTRRC